VQRPWRHEELRNATVPTFANSQSAQGGGSQGCRPRMGGIRWARRYL